MTKAKEFREKSVEDLKEIYNETRKDLFHLRNKMQHDKKLEKPHLLRIKRKDIARLLTILNEKQSASERKAT